MENAKNPETQADAVENAAANSAKLDVIDQLMKPEVQASLNALIEQLPKLTEMTTMLTKTYDLVQTVANDKVLIDDFKGGMMGVLNPVKDKAKYFASAAIEASDRAKTDTTNVGLFDLLRMMKDPQVQKMFRFLQAFMNVLSEREQQR